MDRKPRGLKNGRGEKIIVGMSGGVDSSASLILLKKNGWDPIGVSLKYSVWEDKSNKRENTCCTKDSIRRAGEICKKYRCEHVILDIGKDFYDTVVKYFIESIEKSQTPNPCMICNRKTKFYHLFKYADSKNIKYVATGHYAKITKKGKNLFISIPKDKTKDQTYYLSLLPQEWLERIIFKLGEMTKPQAYNLVKKEKLDFYLKLSQSQDFCFVSEKSMDKFLSQEIKSKEGNTKDEQGNIIGKHNGLQFYTIGQRKKIGLSWGPYFVIKKDPKNNELVVSKNKNNLEKKEIFMSNVFFSDESMYEKKIKVKAKIRYQQKMSPAELCPLKESEKTYRMIFEEPQISVTPGQYAVFYIGKLCIGSGEIC